MNGTMTMQHQDVFLSVYVQLRDQFGTGRLGEDILT